MEKWLFPAYDALRRLGVTADYKGYAYTACALALCAEQPELLLLVTKNLYPQVAKRYQTTWKAVERNIRTVVGVAWQRNPELLGLMAGGPLEAKPHSVRFLAIVSEDLRRGRAGKSPPAAQNALGA